MAVSTYAISTNATQSANPTYASISKPSPAPVSNPIQDELFQPVLSEKGLPSDLVSILRASDDGTLWLQTQQQILILKNNTWEIFLANIPGKLVGVDPSGLVWVINQDGNIWNTYSEESGWIHLSEYSFVKRRPIID